MDKSNYQQFLDIINHEIKELREDLKNLPIKTSNCKVGDFGCGWGYITWCLMREIPNSECIGIDKFDPGDPPNLSQWQFSLDNVRSMFDLIDKQPTPDFQKRDIVKGEKLPSDFDVIYCKRVLYNIFNGKNGETGLNQAIHHIANALKFDGWFCLIEIQEQQFKARLERTLIQANFEFMPPRKVNRLYRTLCGTHKQYPYLIYHCKKTK